MLPSFLAGIKASDIRNLFGLLSSRGSFGLLKALLPLHIADLDALPERGDGIGPFRDEFLRHKTLEPSLDNSFHHGRVIDLLRLIDFAPAGHPARMVVGNVLMVLADDGDQVPFHNLHMVDVVEQFEVLGTDLFAELDTPGAMVTHVIVMISLAVEQLDARGHVVFLGNGHDALGTDHAILEALLVVHALPVAGHANDVWVTVVRHNRRRLLEESDDLVVVFGPIQSAADSAWRAADHRADQTMLFKRWEVRRLHQINRLDADLFRSPA